MKRTDYYFKSENQGYEFYKFAVGEESVKENNIVMDDYGRVSIWGEMPQKFVSAAALFFPVQVVTLQF